MQINGDAIYVAELVGVIRLLEDEAGFSLPVFRDASQIDTYFLIQDTDDNKLISKFVYVDLDEAKIENPNTDISIARAGEPLVVGFYLCAGRFIVDRLARCQKELGSLLHSGFFHSRKFLTAEVAAFCGEAKKEQQARIDAYKIMEDLNADAGNYYFATVIAKPMV